MRARGTAVAVAAAMLSLIGCSAADAVVNSAGRSETARESQCDTERMTLKTAVLAYQATTGEDPPNAAALVEAGFLSGPPENWEFSVDGATFEAVPVPGGLCE